MDGDAVKRGFEAYRDGRRYCPYHRGHIDGLIAAFNAGRMEQSEMMGELVGVGGAAELCSWCRKEKSG